MHSVYGARKDWMWSYIWKISYIELQIWNEVIYYARSYESNLNPWPLDTGVTLTNWAMKTLTLGASHLWALMSREEWMLKLYMKYFICWTADEKSSNLWSCLLYTSDAADE